MRPLLKGVSHRAPESFREALHHESKAHGLRGAGVEVVVGDLAKPETLDAAFSGVDRVFLATPVGPEAVSLASNGIAAARRAGSPHMVRLSAIAASIKVPTRLRTQHLETEAELKGSGLPYTILRPDFFMQNTMMAAQSVASDSTVYMALKDGRFGMIDVRDIADVATKVLTSAGHEGRTYELTGPVAISFHDVTAALSRELGREIKYVDVPAEGAREAMLGVGLPEWTVEAYAEIFTVLADGFGPAVTHDVEDVTGRPARSYETFARDFVEVFAGAAQAA